MATGFLNQEQALNQRVLVRTPRQQARPPTGSFQETSHSETDRSEEKATLARWFWNHTCTTRTLSPVSAARVSLTLKKQSIRNTETLACRSRRQNGSKAGSTGRPAGHGLHRSWVVAHVQQRPKHRTSLPSGGQRALHQVKRKRNSHCVGVHSQRSLGFSHPGHQAFTWVSEVTSKTCRALAARHASALAHLQRTEGASFTRGKTSGSLLLSSPAQIHSPKSLALSLTALGDCIFREYFCLRLLCMSPAQRA